MHWKLVEDYFKNIFQMLDSEKQQEVLDFGKNIQDLYEMFSLEVRGLYQEKKVGMGISLKTISNLTMI